MKGFGGIQSFFRRIWARLIQIGALSREIAAGFFADNCLSMAAAIAYFALLSTIPLLLLGASALGFFLGSSQEAFWEIVTVFKRFFPRTTVGEIEALLRPLIQKKAIAGGVGLFLLLWVAIAVFETIQ
ncbi:MAG: YhjD/YihY/BrkB family envelope integrity protein, partial [Candidatus Methylomirabilales bacterium]